MDLRRGLLPKPTRPDCRLFAWRHNGASPMIPFGTRQNWRIYLSS